MQWFSEEHVIWNFQLKAKRKASPGEACRKRVRPVTGRPEVGSRAWTELQHGRKSLREKWEQVGFRQGPLYCTGAGQKLPLDRKEACQARLGASVQGLRTRTDREDSISTFHIGRAATRSW